MPRPRLPLALLATLVAGVLGAAAAPPGGGPAVAAGTLPAPPPDDPFPIRRLRVSEKRLADLLAADAGGVFVRLPRADFEAKALAAGRAARDAARKPRLVEARYSARLAGNDLAGSGEWVLENPASGPALFPFDLSLVAMRRATWADGREAVVGNFGAGPAVRVERGGTHTLRFDWSAAGAAEPGERRFDLGLPPAPVAGLRLNLPAEFSPVPVGVGLLVTGPFPDPADGGRRGWQVRASGQPRVAFAVRPSDSAADRTGVQAGLVARYELHPGYLAAAFDYDLQPSRGTVGEWAFDVAAGLRVTDVVANNLSGWRAEPGDPGRLRVRLRQPAAGGKVTVRAVAPPPDPDAPLPVVRPTAGLVGAERVEVTVHPDLSPEGWNPGDFRLVDGATATDGGRTLALVGSLAPAGSDSRYRRFPSFRVAPSAADFITHEALDWGADAGRLTLKGSITVRVRRGALFTLPVQLPPGYALARFDSTPADAAAADPRVAGAPPTLAVEFPRPLLPAADAVTLRFELRGPELPPLPWPGGSGPPPAARWPFPRIVPVGVAERDGVLTVAAGPAWDAVPTPAAGPSVPRDPDGATRFEYRGAVPDGTLTVRPRVSRLGVASSTVVTTGEGGLVATTTLSVKVTAGAVAGLVVFDPSPGADGRTWRVAGDSNAVASAVPTNLGELPALLPLLAGGGMAPLTAARVGLESPAGTVWRVAFARPAAGEVVLETAAPLAAAAAEAGTPVPVPRAAGCPGSSCTVEVGGPLAAGWQVAGGALAARGPDPAPPAEDLRLSGLYWTAHAGVEGWATVAFGGVAAAPAGGELPVRLPPGCEPLAARVAGKWAAVAGREPGVVRLPVPPSPGGMPFEVRFRQPLDAGWWGGRFDLPVPEVRNGPAVVRTWVFGREFVPVGGAGGFRDVPAAPRTGPFPTPLAVAWAADGPVVAARVRVVWAVAAGLAGVAAAAGWWLRSRPARPAALAGLAGLFALGAAATAGPGAIGEAARVPVAAGLLVAAAWVLARHAPPAPRPAPLTVREKAPSGRTRGLRAAAVGALVAAFALAARGDDPAPADVYLPEGPADTVFAPRDLLARLDALARPPAPPVVLTAAEFSGKAAGDSARFTAAFTAHVFADGEQVISLPLADIQLEGAEVDGAAANPEALRPDGYAVAVTGRGKHTVTLKFSVSVAGAGGDREVRFGVPELLATRLTFAAPTGATRLHAAGARGAQSEPSTTLEADLGAVRAVQVRWRQGAGRGAAVVRAREASIWTVSEAESELVACHLVRVEQGTVSRLEFDLPADLEPVRVAVRAVEGSAAGTGLRDWAVVPAKKGTAGRLLRLDLPGPTAGRFLVVTEYQPRFAPTRQPALRFPRLMAADTDTVHALRWLRLPQDDVPKSNLIDATPETLLGDREFAALPDLKLDPAATVRVFRPAAAGAPELRPVLRPPAGWAAGSQEVTWRVGPAGGVGEGTIRLVAKDAGGQAAEFDLPGAVQVTDLRGPDMAGWARTGARCQVWFRRPVKDAVVEWAGEVRAAKGATAFDPPVPRVVNVAAPVAAALKVRPPDGWQLRPERDAGWQGVVTAGEWAGRSAGLPPRVTPVPPKAPPATTGALAETAPAPRPRATRPPVPAAKPAADPPPAAADPAPPTLAEDGRWPRLAEWCVGVAVLSLLVWRYPRATWPEQLAAVGGLAGVVFGGGPLVALPVLAAARLVWAVRRR